jgi:hypothetical protein
MHPLTPQQILNFVDTFLTMIEIEILKSKHKKQRKHSQKESAKIFVKKQIRNNIASNQNHLETNKEMRDRLINIAQATREPFVGDLTKSLVENMYREVLTEKGISRKGGAPTKKKPNKKNLRQLKK